MKDFDSWNEEKKKVNNKDIKKLFHEREIWWVSFGINIGREQDGRGDNFERPVIILRTLSPDTFICLPLSTKKRLETFQALVTSENICGFALLDQIRVIDSKRLLRKIETIKLSEFILLKEKMRKLL
jgi:mRNA-degrading endonuclease toxin of MazEF toxin-antitoxin module